MRANSGRFIDGVLVTGDDPSDDEAPAQTLLAVLTAIEAGGSVLIRFDGRQPTSLRWRVEAIIRRLQAERDPAAGYSVTHEEEGLHVRRTG